MGNGWIKLHRQFRQSIYYKEPKAKAVWIECLLRASYDDSELLLRRQNIKLKAGQFCMGRDEFGESIGISGSTVWYWLLRFEADSMVDIKKTAQGSIVSVKNWYTYQEADSTSDNKKTAEKHIKEEKETKEYKEVRTSVRLETKSLYDTIQKACDEYRLQNKVNIKSLDVYVERYIGKIRLGVEFKNCLAWIIDKDLKMINSQRIGNWFKKALEIQKRETSKQSEWQNSQKNPIEKARLKKIITDMPEKNNSVIQNNSGFSSFSDILKARYK